MKHLFIPYDLAVIAKNKGFNEACLSEFTILKDRQELHLNNHFMTNEKISPNIPAPLYQQMIGFLRDNKIKVIEYVSSGWDVYIEYDNNYTLLRQCASINEAINEALIMMTI